MKPLALAISLALCSLAIACESDPPTAKPSEAPSKTAPKPTADDPSANKPADTKPPAEAPDPTLVKLSLLGDARLLIDGKESTLEALATRLDELVKAKGSVLYYREDAGQDPSPAVDAKMQKVLEAIMSRGLPISLSPRPDFSTVVDPNGNEHPR